MPKSNFNQIGLEKSDFIKLTKSFKNLDFTNDLGKILCPTLIICGEKDIPNKNAARQLNKLILNSNLEFIEKASHKVNTDNPKELAKLIDNFYNKI